MSSSPLIQCHTAEAVATLTIARPHKLNALTDAVMKELVATLDGIATDESIRVVVLTGEGRAFSAGFDVSIDKDMPERTPAGWAVIAAAPARASAACRFWVSFVRSTAVSAAPTCRSPKRPETANGSRPMPNGSSTTSTLSSRRCRKFVAICRAAITRCCRS